MRYADYFVPEVRGSRKWPVLCRGADGRLRETGLWYWRRVNALKVASALLTAYNDGLYYPPHGK